MDDRSPDAVAKVVDDLLARPQYGERWARHWLDVVRYAETNGYERDGAKPNAWRYRDYVIDAFNRDKPYDRFLTEQLAGDELAGSDAAAQIATTFLAPGHLGRRAGRADGRPLRSARRRAGHGGDRVPGDHASLCPVPRPQVRAVFAGRLLSHARRLRAAQAPSGRSHRDGPPGWHRGRAGRVSRGRRTARTPASTTSWARIEGLVRPEIERLLGPGGTTKLTASRKARLRCRPRRSRRFRPSGRNVRRPSVNWFVNLPAPLEAAVRAIAPDEVKAALKPLDDRIAGDRGGPAPCPAARLYLDRRGAEAPRDPRAQARRSDTAGCRSSQPGVPAVLVAPTTRSATAVGPDDGPQALAGSLADQPRQPAGRPRDRQPGLAGSFRPRARRVVERSGRHGRCAVAIPSCWTGWPRSSWPPAGGSSRCTG